jgi:hypothetical protein
VYRDKVKRFSNEDLGAETHRINADSPEGEATVPIFERQIFLGNGDHSIRAIETLHELVDQAMAILSGLQQPDSPHASKEDIQFFDQERIKWQGRYDALVDQIVVALTGQPLTRHDPGTQCINRN